MWVAVDIFKYAKLPYIIWAHTSAGIFAMELIDRYPDEIEGLVGADMYPGDAIYEMVKDFHSFDEMQRYFIKVGKMQTISQKIRDYLSITGFEVTAYEELMYFKHTDEEKEAFGAAYGRYNNNRLITEENRYYIDAMKAVEFEEQSQLIS